MEERDKLREEKQKGKRGQELNPDLPGERPISYPIHQEDLIQKTAFLFEFNLYFLNVCLENRAKLEILPSK